MFCNLEKINWTIFRQIFISIFLIECIYRIFHILLAAYRDVSKHCLTSYAIQNRYRMLKTRPYSGQQFFIQQTTVDAVLFTLDN